MMFGDRVHIYPIVLAVYVPISFVITYAIAVANSHVEAGFPYISDTGAHPPESCVFGQLLNLGAVLGGITIYIRYWQIVEHYAEASMPRKLRNINNASFVFGMMMALGVSLVGNFQENNVIIVHLIGAFMAFGIGFVYCCLQTYISSVITDIPGIRPATQIIRKLICVLDFIFIVVLLVVTPFAQSKLTAEDKKAVDNDTFKWSKSGGYGEHLTSTISEWLMAIAIVLYFITYVPEFKKFEIAKPCLKFKKLSYNEGIENPIPIEGDVRGAPA